MAEQTQALNMTDQTLLDENLCLPWLHLRACTLLLPDNRYNTTRTLVNQYVPFASLGMTIKYN
jgi:hypothetical protein